MSQNVRHSNKTFFELLTTLTKKSIKAQKSNDTILPLQFLTNFEIFLNMHNSMFFLDFFLTFSYCCKYMYLNGDTDIYWYYNDDSNNSIDDGNDGDDDNDNNGG